MPTFDKDALLSFGQTLKGILDIHKRDRALLENQWLTNLRQYLGKYDPSVLNKIPEERSKVYPRDTRVKVKGGVAKMMEMMFPSQERNYAIDPSPSPSIPAQELQKILDQVTEAQLPEEMASNTIERQVMEFARTRAMKMETEIADQLSDAGVDYPQLCKRVVRSGYIYGFGVAHFPQVRKQSIREWQVDPNTGVYVAVTKSIKRPHPTYVRVWDCFPDLTAKQWDDQEFFFERIILMRSDLRRLAQRNDFMSDEIKEYLSTHPDGNYTAQSYEAELNTIANISNVANRNSRRYEIYRGVGFVSGAQLAKVGVEVKESQLLDDVFVEAWIIDDRVIKIAEASFGERPSDQYHAFIYAEDEDSGLTGVGLPEEVRDSQMTLCAATRALMDNMAASAGPMYEVNVTLLAKGKKSIGALHPFKVIEREGDGLEAQYPAIRPLSTDSHIAEILNIINAARQQLDIESNLPAYTMGGMNQPLGEAFRTSSNMSMMIGSANMVTKDTVRAFDKFTSSLIGAMLKWNMEFNDNPDIKGDFQVVAKGNLSLVAKEVRGAALDQFVMTLTPEERAILDTYGVLIDRLKARDLPTDRMLPREEAEQVLKSLREAAAQSAQIDQSLTEAKTAVASAQAGKIGADTELVMATAEATIEEILSRIDANSAKAQSQADKTQLENLKILLSTTRQKGGRDGGGQK